jgi:hypothetical protein
MRKRLQGSHGSPQAFPQYQTLKVLPEEQARQIIVSSQERYDQTKRFYQSGNLPLPIVAKWLSKPLPLLWRIFSYDADVKLLSAIGSYEEQQNSYSTANQASQIVIDYSALITLYYSGLMDLPQEFLIVSTSPRVHLTKFKRIFYV